MTTYQTKYSDISNLSKKEKKIKENQFPYIAPNSNLGHLDICGQIVSKTDVGNNIKFCPLCDFPMIVRMMIIPCEHVMCYQCTQPNKGYCYICEGKIENTIRISDTSKLYECDWPDCFKFFTNIEKLSIHRLHYHNQGTEGMPNTLMGGMMPMGMMGGVGMMNKVPGMVYPGVHPSGFMPMMGGIYQGPPIPQGTNPPPIQPVVPNVQG